MTDDLFNFGGGIFAFLILILDIIVIAKIIESNRDIPSKLAWSALIFFFPVFGVIIYYISGAHHRHADSGYNAIV